VFSQPHISPWVEHLEVTSYHLSSCLHFVTEIAKIAMRGAPWGQIIRPVRTDFENMAQFQSRVNDDLILSGCYPGEPHLLGKGEPKWQESELSVLFR
jgi:hypothetical protein